MLGPPYLIALSTIQAFFESFLANFLWVIAYDTVYGMIDAADDEKLNIGNSARYFGRRKEKWVFLLGLAHLFIYFFVGLSLNLDLSFLRFKI